MVVELKWSLKYLGVTFARTLNFNENIRRTRENAMKTANKLVNVTRKRYQIVKRMAKPTVLYAVPVRPGEMERQR